MYRYISKSTIKSLINSMFFIYIYKQNCCTCRAVVTGLILYEGISITMLFMVIIVFVDL